MAGISSKAAGKTENKKKYNGIEETRELDLNEYDAFYRTLDPQIGRWWQIDPKIENQEDVSPYASMANDPILKSDPLGDEPEESQSGPGPQTITLGKDLYRAYRLYQAGQSLSRSLESVSLRDIANALMPFGQGGQIPLKTLNGESASQGAAIAIEFVKQVQNIVLKTEKADEIKKVENDIKSLDKSIKNLNKNVKEHEQKLEDYKNNPDKYDNKGQLQNVNSQMRQQRINGRIRALEKQIKKNQGELNKAQDQKQQKQLELDKLKN